MVDDQNMIMNISKMFNIREHDLLYHIVLSVVDAENMPLRKNEWVTVRCGQAETSTSPLDLTSRWRAYHIPWSVLRRYLRRTLDLSMATLDYYVINNTFSTLRC